MNRNVEIWIEQHKEDLIKSLQESIRFKSVEAEPTAGAPFGKAINDALEHALALAEGFGFKCLNLDGYAGCIDYGEGDETLGVMSHLDVVPEGTGWIYPAYGGEIHDGRIYGRGAMDNKGPAIASIYALAAIKACGIVPDRKIRLILGCDEESGWACMKHYAECEPLPDLAFSPDAEYPLVYSEKAIFHGTYVKPYASNIILKGGERGNVVPGEAKARVTLPLTDVQPVVTDFLINSKFRCEASAIDETSCEIVMKGLDAHAAMPELGKNAVLAMLDLLAKLPLIGEDAQTARALTELLRYDIHGENFGLDREDKSGRLTLNAGVIDWDEKGVNTLILDIRAPITLERGLIEQLLREGFAPAGLKEQSTGYKDGHYVDPESELVSKLMEVYTRRSGENLPPLAIGGGTYARCIPNAVAFGCERPGKEALVHMPNESLEIEDLMFNTFMIADAILALAVRN